MGDETRQYDTTRNQVRREEMREEDKEKRRVVKDRVQFFLHQLSGTTYANINLQSRSQFVHERSSQA